MQHKPPGYFLFCLTPVTLSVLHNQREKEETFLAFRTVFLQENEFELLTLG